MIQYTFIDENGFEDGFDIRNHKDNYYYPGGSLIGYISENYHVLRDIFGEPAYEDKNSYSKTTCEWRLSINNEDISIYDYKGESWHVGGSNRYAFDIVKDIIRIYKSGNLKISR